MPGDVVLEDGAPVAGQGPAVVQARASGRRRRRAPSPASSGRPRRGCASAPTRSSRACAPSPPRHSSLLRSGRDSRPDSIGGPSPRGPRHAHGLSPLRRDRRFDSRVPPLRGGARQGPRRARPAPGARLALLRGPPGAAWSSPPSASRSSWPRPRSTCVACRHHPPRDPRARGASCPPRPPARRVDRIASPVAPLGRPRRPPPPEVADAALRAASAAERRPGGRRPSRRAPARAGAALLGRRARGRGRSSLATPCPRRDLLEGVLIARRLAAPRRAALRRRGRAPRAGPGRGARPALGAARRCSALRLETGDWAAAEGAARDAPGPRPADAEAARGLAYALVRQDRSREAIERPRRLRRRAPRPGDPRAPGADPARPGVGGRARRGPARPLPRPLRRRRPRGRRARDPPAPRSALRDARADLRPPAGRADPRRPPVPARATTTRPARPPGRAASTTPSTAGCASRSGG